MRLQSLAILCVSALFVASPAFAQMTQQNKQNQGHAANPPMSSSHNQGNATEANRTSSPQAGSSSNTGSNEHPGAKQDTTTR